MKLTEKQDLPSSINNEMDLWRMGFGGMPAEYIKFHYKRATEERKALVAQYGLTVLSKELVSDGWMDGMRVQEVRATTKSGRDITLRWHDSSQSFFKRKHGSSLLSEKDLL
tara:strand:- start:476 stop:808 length:333 start_codon:yes stop_codon:yes gene_type:complete